VLKYFYNIIIYLQIKTVSILRYSIRLNRLVIKYNLISNQFVLTIIEKFISIIFNLEFYHKYHINFI
jgi:hypothetical protein